MLAWMRHFLNPAYLYAVEPSSTLEWSSGILIAGAIHLMIAGALAVWMVWRGNTRGRVPRWGWMGVVGWAVAGLHTLARPLLWGLASARAWAFSCAALGTIVIIVGLAPGVLGPFGVWIRCRPAILWGGVAGLHGLGLAGWWLCDGPSLPLALALVGLALDVGICWRRPASWSGLIMGAPLTMSYASLGLRWLVGGILGVDVAAYQAFAGADLVSPWFHAPTMAWAGAGGTLLLGLRRAARSEGLFLRWAGVATLLAGLAIAGSVGWCHVAAGVTASDPYCYLQMAADLAERDTVFHSFPLAAVAREAGVSLWPVVHVGYHVPDAHNAATTVWPIGWPLLLAPVYWAFGEGVALWGAMVCLLAAAVLTAWLCRWLLRDSPWGGWLAAGLAGLLVVTSQEALLRSLVPMADAAAALFSVAMLACLVRARETRAMSWSLAAGGCYAIAYGIRHPLLFLGLGALPAYGVGRAGERIAWRGLLTFAAAALAMAAPDLVYHTVAFGAPWLTESREWSLLGPGHVLPNAWSMLVEGFDKRTEFGYLWPFLIWGLVDGWCHRLERGIWLVLAWSLVGATGFQLGYQALRWRDLVSLLPWFAIWVAMGLQAFLQWLPASRWRFAGITLVLVMIAGRCAWVLELPTQEVVSVFGHVTGPQREAYRQLGERLPADAVVATSLSSGAIERYAGHEAMRPASWDEQEFAAMLNVLRGAGREVWLLDDGDETEALLGRMPSGWSATGGFCYDLPTFGWGGELLGRKARLWKLVVEPSSGIDEP